MRFLITGGADSHYEPRCGGVRVLHYLANLLALIGEHVTTSFPCHRFFPDVPEIEQRGDADNSTFVVYPDSIAGNPRGASRIVRYLLYFTSYRIPSSELPIIFHSDYFDQVSKQCDHAPTQDQIVTLPALEPGLFYVEQKSIEAVFYAGKGAYDPPPGAVVIERFRESREEAISMLRRSRNFYTTDIHSIMPLEANLCGCKSYIKRGDEWVLYTNMEAEEWFMRPERDKWKATVFAALCYDFFKA